MPLPSEDARKPMIVVKNIVIEAVPHNLAFVPSPLKSSSISIQVGSYLNPRPSLSPPRVERRVNINQLKLAVSELPQLRQVVTKNDFSHKQSSIATSDAPLSWICENLT